MGHKVSPYFPVRMKKQRRFGNDQTKRENGVRGISCGADSATGVMVVSAASSYSDMITATVGSKTYKYQAGVHNDSSATWGSQSIQKADMQNVPAGQLAVEANLRGPYEAYCSSSGKQYNPAPAFGYSVIAPRYTPKGTFHTPGYAYLYTGSGWVTKTIQSPVLIR